MKWIASVAVLLVGACAAPAPHRGDDDHPPHEHGQIVVPEPVLLECSGALVQGGAARCNTTPRAEVRVDGELVGLAGADGWIDFNFSNAAPPVVRVEAHKDGVSTFVDLTIERR